MKPLNHALNYRLLLFGGILLLMGSVSNGEEWEPENLKEGCTGEVYIDTIVVKNYDFAPPWTLTYGGTETDPTGWLHIDEDPFPPTKDTCIITADAAGAPGLYSFRITVENTTSTPPFASKVYQLRIHPKPVIDAGQSKTVCSGENADYEILLAPANTPPGTLLNWAAPVMSDGSSQGSAGYNVAADPLGTKHIQDVFVNQNSSPITATYTITPIVGYNCTGASGTVVITINPEPVLADLDDAVCSDLPSNITLSVATGSVAASTYNITGLNSNGLSASAGAPAIANNQPADVLSDDAWTNTNAADVDVVYTVVPVSAVNCPGAAKGITLTVQPEPVLAARTESVCSGEVTGIVLEAEATGIPASTYNITDIDDGGLTATAGNPAPGNGLSDTEIQDDIWENASINAVDVVYTVAPVGANTCIGDENTVTVTVNPTKDFDVMLVLDISGSMGDPCPGCEESKLKELKKAVQAFMDPLINDHYYRPDRDRIGVVFFQSIVDESGASPIYIHDDVQLNNLFNNVINPQTDGGATAMGGGLQTGIDSLLRNNELGNSQNIILVTDGMQNRNPMIVYEPDEIRIKDVDVSLPGPPYGNSDVDPHPSPLEINDELGVRIFSIGINATGDYADLLMKLADSTDGTHNIEPAADALKFDQFFTQSFVDMMRGCSPQLIDYRFGTLSNETKTEVFAVEEGVNHVLLKLSGKTTDGSNLRFSVRKDGEDLTHAGHVSDKAHYRIYSIDLPATTGGKTIQAAGDWEMVISGKSDMDYRACAIVDNAPLRYESTVGWQYNFAGNPLELAVSLFDNLGRPIEDASVTADIYNPSRKWDRILSNASVARMLRWRFSVLKKDLNYLDGLYRTDSVLVDLPDHAARKRQLLIQSKKFSRFFKPEQASVSLIYQGNGLYSLKYTGTRKTGIYKIDFRIEGKLKGRGEFRRIETRSGIIHFGKPDLRRSKLRLIPPETDNDIPLRLYIRPKDEFGNLLGPGYAHSIKIVTGGKIGFPTDHLDGSYTIPLYGIERDTGGKMKVIVAEQTVFEGSPEELNSRLCFLIRKNLVFNQGMEKGKVMK